MPPKLAYLLTVFTGAKSPPSVGVPSRPARTMPVRLRLYIAAVTITFLAAAAISLLDRPEVTAGRLGTAASLALLMAIARMFPVRLAPKRKLVVDTAPAFAAALLLPAPLAITTAAVGMLAGELRVRGPWFQAVFNSAVAGLRVGAAAVMYHAAAGMPLHAMTPVKVSPLALLLSGTTLYLVGSVLVDVAAGLTLGQSPFANWREVQRRKVPPEAVLQLLGVFAALPARDNPWLLPLLLVPAAIVRHSLQEGLPIKSEAREALESLAETVDLRHQRSADHSRRVAELARTIARRMDLAPKDVALVADAARLRDIGEIAVPPDMLATTQALTDEQRTELHKHSAVGAEMVHKFADFSDCTTLILHHHERWDGSGSPGRLTGESIPLGSRIIAVAERYEALIASRPYRDALTPVQARAELRRAAGSQLDPRIVQVLLALLGDGAPVDLTTTATAAAVRMATQSLPRGGGL